jgi:hypothetical protein
MKNTTTMTQFNTFVNGDEVTVYNTDNKFYTLDSPKFNSLQSLKDYLEQASEIDYIEELNLGHEFE